MLYTLAIIYIRNALRCIIINAFLYILIEKSTFLLHLLFSTTPNRN